MGQGAYFFNRKDKCRRTCYVGNKYERIRRAMGLDANEDIAEFFEGLNERIGIPKSLAQMGVRADMMTDLLHHSMIDVMTFTNPRPVSEKDYELMFTGLL